MFKFWMFLWILAIHNSGSVRPVTTRDSRERCGSVLCQKVSETFSQAKLNGGYNFITTIPAGAMNLTVRQLDKSENLIALKTKENEFIINGQNRASPGGIYEYNGDAYDYNDEAGLIAAKGPLNSPVVLMLLVAGFNPGVQYTYRLPVPSAFNDPIDDIVDPQWNELGQPLEETVTKLRQKKPPKYLWSLSGFTQCSRTCGPGKQSPIFRCIRESKGKANSNHYFSPKRCADQEKPTFKPAIYYCNRGLCPAFWRTDEFGECECSKGVEGVKRRNVTCIQEQENNELEIVEESKCRESKRPEAEEKCNCQKTKLYARNVDKANQMYARLIGSPSNLKLPMSKRNSPLATSTASPSLKRNYRNDKTGVWVMSDWNQQCHTDCSSKYEHRTVYCDRTPPYTDQCDRYSVPDTKRPCTNRSKLCRRGMWVASDWSSCAGDCLNRRRTRKVLCVVEGYVVDHKQCDIKTRPIEHTNCTSKDATLCGPKWHYSEWSECSRSCGEGVQRRYAKCLEFDLKRKTMIESNKCKYVEREPVYAACNMNKCEEPRTYHNNLAASGLSTYNGDYRDWQEKVAVSRDDVSGVVGDYSSEDHEHNYDMMEENDDDEYEDVEETYLDENFNRYTGDILKTSTTSTTTTTTTTPAPRYVPRCHEELPSCQRINRERLCRMEYYRTLCCLTCHAYY